MFVVFTDDTGSACLVRPRCLLFEYSMYHHVRKLPAYAYEYDEQQQ